LIGRANETCVRPPAPCRTRRRMKANGNGTPVRSLRRTVELYMD